MYIVEMYVIIVTCISPRNLAVYIRPANLVEKIAPGGLTNSAPHATLAKLTIRSHINTHNTPHYQTLLNLIKTNTILLQNKMKITLLNIETVK